MPHYVCEIWRDLENTGIFEKPNTVRQVILLCISTCNSYGGISGAPELLIFSEGVPFSILNTVYTCALYSARALICGRQSNARRGACPKRFGRCRCDHRGDHVPSKNRNNSISYYILYGFTCGIHRSKATTEKYTLNETGRRTGRI